MGKLFNMKNRNKLLEHPITVLSLFDGISCGAVALERAGFTFNTDSNDRNRVDRYVAYEIDESAIKISKNHYTQIEQCGSVVGADFTQYKGFDLLIGGSPCQNLCCMGDRKGLHGEQSKLFFEYVRALKEVKPKWFLLENNASMSKENREIITNIIGVEPIMIDSIDFSAQHRKRLYWTNIWIEKYEPKRSILLKDIVEPVSNKQKYNITDIIHKYKSTEYNNRKIQKNISNKIKTLDDVSSCIGTCVSYSNNTGLIIRYGNEYYNITPLEAERLQTLPDNYTQGLSDNKRFYAIGNGWTVDVIAYILSYISPKGIYL